MDNNKTLEGKLTISKVHSNMEDDYIQIQLEDVNSKVCFVEVKVSLLAFAQTITGMGNVDCQFETRGADKIGLTREIKYEEVSIAFDQYGDHPGKNDIRIREACKSKEIDGWTARYSDCTNFRTMVSIVTDAGITTKTHRVLFERWVKNEKDTK
jgi:hypothetical protein